uniref:hypothetical protein n=1 Tax=Algoriphagus sp. TaxID=1872435 RepID=UPI00404821EF
MARGNVKMVVTLKKSAAILLSYSRKIKNTLLVRSAPAEVGDDLFRFTSMGCTHGYAWLDPQLRILLYKINIF